MNGKASSGSLWISGLLASLFFLLGVRELLTNPDASAYLIHPASSTGAPISYAGTEILLTYRELTQFTDFLRDHSQQIIRLDARLSFDAATQINLAVHAACQYQALLEQLTAAPAQLQAHPIALATFANDASVSHCRNQLQWQFLQPETLAFVYGGTGTLGIPIKGDFQVEVQPNGDAIRYQLIQVK